MTSAAGTLSGPLPRQRLLVACAWGVHLYTALGAAAGLLAIYYAAGHNFPLSFIVIGITIFIDSSDGSLARLLDVKHRVPSFDGSLLDNIVDYLTYTVAAVFLMLEAGIIPKTAAGLVLACLIMLASAYGFCQTGAKTDDHYFLGFPNYWNIVAFYLYCLHWPPVINWAVLLIFAVLVFVPIKYIYPSRTVALRALTLGYGILWAIVTFAMLPMLPRINPIMLGVSLSYIVYYFLASFILHARAAWSATP
ncbi:MAG TPA: CDP-alcohol phosphatidyltransferase family protein [Candidatus Binataceae bacterium]|nr:CDP-alcohol phosphatidyltransferase family protein [Candidatus Binataceae bacterium]